jgi:hypothetical protein
MAWPGKAAKKHSAASEQPPLDKMQKMAQELKLLKLPIFRPRATDSRFSKLRKALYAYAPAYAKR